jgi:hypothetical protein
MAAHDSDRAVRLRLNAQLNGGPEDRWGRRPPWTRTDFGAKNPREKNRRAKMARE